MLFRSELAADSRAAAEEALAELAATAVALKNPDIPQQIQWLQDMLGQVHPAPVMVQVARLLAAGASLPYARSAAQLDGAAPEQPLVDPLSERELEILVLIIAGLKNKEIAEKLFISLNTVLYHNKNIYSKLGVSKRTLAIARARELGLIQ